MVANFTASPIKTTRLRKLNKLFEVMGIRGVKVFAHWSVLLIGAVILLSAREKPLLAVTVLATSYGVILIHDCSHMIAAQHQGCRVWSIELYPTWGITRFSEPYCYFDRCVVAWGGVVAQAIVAVPLLIWAETSGYTSFQAVNAILAILGFFSLSAVVFNLLPIRPLDGAIAWGLPSAFLKRLRAKPATRKPGWQSWRQVCRLYWLYSHCLTLLRDTAYSFVEGIFRPCAGRTGVARG